MKFEFLWFEGYKKLNNFQSDFGSEYIYKFDYEKKTFIIEKDYNYIKNYFSTEKSNKLSVSAIVGENGVGKSTILDFISDFIKDKLNDTKYLVVFLESDKRIIVHNLNIEDEIKFVFDKDINKQKFAFDISEYSEVLEKVPNTLFFSNVFDVRYLRRHYESLGDTSFYTDISTNFLLWESNNNIVGFLNKEFEKQIYFIYDYLNELEVMGIIKKPDYIKLTLIEGNEDSDYEKFSLLDNSSITFDKKVVTKAYFGFINSSIDKYKGLVYVEILKEYLFLANNVIEKMMFEDEVPTITEIYDEYSFALLKRAKKIFGINESYNQKDILSYLPLFVKAYLLEFTNIEKEDIDLLTQKLINLSNSVKNFCIKLSEINFFHLEEELKPTAPSINNIYIKTAENIRSFINLHKELFKIHPIFNFSWTELSSGEHGLLNLFGRIYSAFKEIEIDNESSNSYLLLIDEGDLYFHPQWQKDWLYYFIQFINNLFDVDVQIILTTHSPLVLSDFPNSNVLFIGGNIVDSYNLEGSPRTLGANILELFSNSFFLKQGLVGRYGKNQINKFTRELITSSPKNITKNKVTYQTFIDNIGEPLVRNQLTEILKGKLSLADNNDIDERIKALENEINNLKKMRVEGD